MRNILFYMLVNVVNAGLGFMTLRITTELLSIEEFAKIGVFYSLLYFIYPLCHFGSIGLLRVTFFKGEYSKFRNTIFTLSVIINTTSFFVFFLIFSAVSISYSWLLIIAVCIVRIFKETIIMELLCKRDINNWIKTTLLFSFTQIVLVFPVLSFTDDWYYRIICYLLSEMIVIILMIRNTTLVSLRINPKFISKSKKDLTRILSYGLPVIVGVLPAWTFEEADKLIILKFFNMEMVGVYTACYMLGSVINLFTSTILNYTSRIYFEKLKHCNSVSYILKDMVIHGLVFISVYILFICSFNYFPFVFLPEKYHDYKSIVYIVSLSFIIIGFSRMLSTFLEYNERNIDKLFVSFISASVNVVISFLFLDTYGVYSPAIGTLIGAISSVTFVIFFSMKFHKQLNFKLG